MTQTKKKSYTLNPEKVAYWYLRLNGFLQIEDFYVHPRARGGARTDADILAVRFPYRAERLYDDNNDIMEDDKKRLSLLPSLIDVIIAEVKTGQCGLNGPWTDPSRKNVHRVLAAIGCLPIDQIKQAAEAIYHNGSFIYRPQTDRQTNEFNVRIRLLSIGEYINNEQRDKYPEVLQLVWSEILSFIFERMRKYRNQKKQTEHWDRVGIRLKKDAAKPGSNKEDVVGAQLLAIKQYAK